MIWMVPLVLLPIAEPWEHSQDYEDRGVPFLVYLSMMTGCFYFNVNVLYPRYLVPKKTVRYIFLAIATALTVGTIYTLVFYNYQEGPIIINVILKAVLALVFIACGTGYKAIADSFREQRLRQLKENENLKTELSFLRSQISPHFMFNVLNGIVALIRQKSDKLEPVVIELSNLMRYMLYESDEENVSLKTELEYLKSYIDLQTHRFGDDIKLSINIPDLVPDRSIEPMLLIPLVENAFKHGYDVIKDPEIRLDLELTDTTLTMTIKNKYLIANPLTKGRNAGIGLINLQRRLNLLYPGKHSFEIRAHDNWFTVQFTLLLKNDISDSNQRAHHERVYA